MKRLFAGFILSLIALGCGPEPTSPATTNLAGVWVGNAHVFELSNIRLNIIQEPQGIVSGTWTADGDGGNGGCLPNVPCKASGNLIGRNTVSQVELEVLGAGKFEGVLKQGTTLRGIFAVNISYDSISFTRTSATVSADIKSGGK